MTEQYAIEPDVIAEINRKVCGAGQPVVLDAQGLEAAASRPLSGTFDAEAFPSVYQKTAALLHGLASRQIFEDGNKRTAWVVANAFLEANGVDLGHIHPSHSNMFVRAVAVDHTIENDEIAEWFQIAELAHMIDTSGSVAASSAGKRGPVPSVVGALLLAQVRASKLMEGGAEAAEVAQADEDARLLVRELLSIPGVTAHAAVHTVTMAAGYILEAFARATKLDFETMLRENIVRHAPDTLD